MRPRRNSKSTRLFDSILILFNSTQLTSTLRHATHLSLRSVESVGLVLTNQDILDVFELLDKSESGYLDCREFLRLFPFGGPGSARGLEDRPRSAREERIDSARSSSVKDVFRIRFDLKDKVTQALRSASEDPM